MPDEPAAKSSVAAVEMISVAFEVANTAGTGDGASASEEDEVAVLGAFAQLSENCPTAP